MTERCSLQDAFNINVALFNIYNWRHSDCIIKKLRNKFPTKRVCLIIHILKINEKDAIFWTIYGMTVTL